MQNEILAIVVSALPGWALFALDVWDRLRRRRKYKQADESREEVSKR